MYKNVPLIERLETSDKKDYSQIVIAIDVSGSTAGEPVKNSSQKFTRYVGRFQKETN